MSSLHQSFRSVDDAVSLQISRDTVSLRDGRPRRAPSLMRKYEAAALLPDPEAIGDSLYAHLDAIGRPVVRALQHIRAINASADMAARVGIDTGTAMLLMTRIGYLADNTPIELTDTYCRDDYYDFVAELRR